MNAQPHQPPAAPLLRLSKLTRRYGTTTVVDGCSPEFRAGEIHALLGANGAGKSTLVRMMAGLVAPSAGGMELRQPDGRFVAYAPANKRDAERRGIEIVQQELNLIPTLSIAENLLLTRLPATVGVIRTRELHAHARAALQRLDLADLPTATKVAALGVGQQQMIEIAAALDRDCRLLILDEPTAALSGAESEILFEWLGRLRRDGVCIVYISHRLEEVRQLADRVSVLRDGRHVGTFDAADCSVARMVALMSGESDDAPMETDAARGERGVDTGRPLDTADKPDTPHTPDSRVTALRVENLCGGPVQEVSFEVHRGETLGIAGLVGSGRTELLRLIFGADRPISGGIALAGDRSLRRFHHPSQAVEAGLAMVTEDRKHNGLLVSQSIRSNTTMAALWQRFASCGITRGRAERATTEQQCASLEVRCEDIEQLVSTLSGGNQQKVAVAKWLVRDADVFLFDEPTRGIDVAARKRIYRLLNQLTDQDKAIVMVSSDLDELLETCDRIAVMSSGRMVATFTRGDWSRERIMQAAFSGHLDRRPA